MSAPATPEGRVRVSVWDLPTRLFHWALVILIGVAWWSISTRQLGIHRTAGALVAGLLVFRLWWGLFGGSTARFSDFVRGPRTVLDYARGLLGRSKAVGHTLTAGHNPMGGWSVLALIATVLAIVGFGLFSVDVDGLESGPLTSLVSFEQGRLASRWHDMAFDALKILVLAHLAAMVFYRLVRRENLVTPMVSGAKWLEGAAVPLRPARLWALIIGVLLGGAVAAVLIRMNG